MADNRSHIRSLSDVPLESALIDLGLEESLPTQIGTPTPRAHSRAVPRWRRTSVWLLAYGLVLALIVFWPEPVDSGLSPLLRRLHELLPVLTYERVEFGSNVLLFAPLGAGLALLLRDQRYLVVPLGVLASLAIESIQAIALADRTPSAFDIVANVAGTCLGLVGVAAADGLRSSMRLRKGPKAEL